MSQNPLVVSKASPIHGVGLFATADIVTGQRLLEYAGERISKRESLERCQANNQCIFALDEETDLDGNVEWNLARFVNHHCQPNSETQLVQGQIWIVAIRHIRAGEEITFNYGYDLESYREYPCHCGAKSCVGYIVAEAFFPMLRERTLVSQ